MTDPARRLHEASMVRAVPLAEARVESATPELDFETVYQHHFDFIWRSLRRLGVAEAAIDDAAQDVFVIAHQRLATFRGDSTVKTWLFGIAYRVARKHRPERLSEELDAEVLFDPRARTPHDLTLEEEARRVLYRLLSALDEERRAVFILAELEGMSAPEIAGALGVKLNTVYSRLRLARAEFQAQLTRHRAAERRKS